jgi:hypothetical protein
MASGHCPLGLAHGSHPYLDLLTPEQLRAQAASDRVAAALNRSFGIEFEKAVERPQLKRSVRYLRSVSQEQVDGLNRVKLT